MMNRHSDGLHMMVFRGTQSRRETSSSSTDDDLDDSGVVEKGARWANESLWHDELQRVQMRVTSEHEGVQTLLFSSSFYGNIYIVR